MQVHAEQFLMANLVLHGEQSLQTLAISAAPCGHCRQFYSELACAVSTALYNV
jgi:cytidine deaminase